MRELDYVWSSNTSSGAQSHVRVIGDLLHSAWYFRASGGVTSATIIVQSALSSGGPWYDEATSTVVTANTMHVLRISGPMGFARPSMNSTGITVRAIGVS
jgi:hypothetical protein